MKISIHLNPFSTLFEILVDTFSCRFRVAEVTSGLISYKPLTVFAKSPFELLQFLKNFQLTSKMQQKESLRVLQTTYFKNKTKGVLVSNHFKNQTQEISEIILNYFKNKTKVYPEINTSYN